MQHVFMPLNVHAVRWLIRNGSSSSVSVFLYLASCANEYGICYPPQDRIAEACSLARSTVQDALSWLIGAGLIGVAQESSRDDLGRYRTTTYIVSPHVMTGRSEEAYEMWRKVAPSMTDDRSLTIFQRNIHNKNQEQESTRRINRIANTTHDRGALADEGGASAKRRHPQIDLKELSPTDQGYAEHIAKSLAIRKTTVAGYLKSYGTTWCLKCYDQTRSAAAAGTIRNPGAFWIAAVRGELRQPAQQAGD